MRVGYAPQADLWGVSQNVTCPITLIPRNPANLLGPALAGNSLCPGGKNLMMRE
jgi:hypothetical protein